MASKGDNEQFTLEKVRSTYTSLTVEDRSSSVKSSSVSPTTTTAPSITTKASSQQNVTSADDKNVETKHPQLKQVAEKRKIPPYTNFPNMGPSMKTNKAHTKNSTSDTSTNVVRKKQESFSSIPESAIPPNSKVAQGKSCISLSFVNKETSIQAPKTSSEKLVSYLAPKDKYDSNSPDFQDQMKQLSSDTISGAIEKNIQTKALTVLSIKNSSSPIPLKLNSSKSMKGLVSGVKPVICGRGPTNSDLFKPSSKSSNARPSVELESRNVLPRFPGSSSVQIASKVNSTVVNVSELPNDVQNKSASDDSVLTGSPKQQLSSSGNAKFPVETSSSNLTKQTATSQPSQRVLKPKSALSVTSIPNSLAVPQETIHANIRGNPNTPITVLLSSLSEAGDSNGLLEAINSGSNVNVTQSVTLSKPVAPAVVVVQQSVLNQKIRASVTAEVPQKTNASNSIPTSGNPRKNTSVTEISTRSLSPRVDAPQETIASSSLVNVGKHDSSAYMISSDETEANEEMNSPMKNLPEEPECLTISSDEEAEETLSEKNGISYSVMSKEPPVAEKNEKSPARVDSRYDVYHVLPDGSVLETDEESALDATSGEGYVQLNCRTIRIGSFKTSPRHPVVLSKHGLRIVIPCMNTNTENVVLKIPVQEMTRVLIHFGPSVPVIFYYVTSQMGAKVRRLLKMNDPDDVYFDPTTNIQSQRRITLLPEDISESRRMHICEIFKDTGIMKDLNHDEANEILVKSVPREVQRVVKQVPDPVQTIMVFPPPPAKGGISINTEDYACLAPDIFLNDVIIDFYLKYLYSNHLSAEDREKTHIFSSFFYKRLTDKATPMPRQLKSAGDGITAADIRHSRVKNWTKNIDIFSKDYIVIPLNENQHWFLAIICFPGLDGPVKYSDNTPIEVESKKKKVASTADETLETCDAEKVSSTIGSVTITPIKLESKEKTRICFDDDNDAEDRDEAEATDEEVISEEDTDEEYLHCETEAVVQQRQRRRLEREPIKQPCILIFDSLAGASRARIIATLRDYLRVEYKVKHDKDRDFSKNVVKGTIPHVPQQDNFTDCGLFVLQYVEAFFDNKITDYHVPIRSLRNWFNPEEVGDKRRQIQQLLHELMKAQNIDVDSLNLPNLHLSPSDDEDYYDSEEDDDYDISGEGDDYDIIELDSANRYHVFADEHEYYEDEEEEEEDDEEEMLAGSRYDVYDDSDDETREDMDSDEDVSDDVYKGLDDIAVQKTRKYRRKLHHRMENSGRCMEEDEEINMEEIATNEDEDEQLSSDIEEKINNSNIDRGTVSITSLNSRTVSPASSSGIGAVTSTTSNTRLKEVDIARLKAVRPWASRAQSNDECSTTKKFKQN